MTVDVEIIPVNTFITKDPESIPNICFLKIYDPGSIPGNMLSAAWLGGWLEYSNELHVRIILCVGFRISNLCF